MNRFLITLLFASTALFFTSCQKELSPEGGSVVTPPPPTANGTYLAQYLEIDSVPGSMPDTSTVLKMQYDAQHRLVSLFAFNSATASVTLAFYEKYFYQYNGSDTLPSRVIYELREEDATSNLNTANDTSYYTYNAAGKVILDSASRNHSSSLGVSRYFTKSEYSYFNGFFVIKKTDTDGGTINQSLDSVFVTAGSSNNLSALRSVNYPLPDNVPDYNYSSSFLYDNHPNPFCLPALYATIPLFEFESTSVSLFQKNNPVNISQTSSYSGPTTENITYTYNANGYPAVFYSTYTSDDGTGAIETRYYKGVFSYN
jgi:hypothetical protein